MKPDIHLVENSSCIDVVSSSYDNRIAVATDKYVYVLEQRYNPSFRFDFLNLSKEIVKDTKEDHQFYDVGVNTAEIKKLPKGSCNETYYHFLSNQNVQCNLSSASLWKDSYIQITWEVIVCPITFTNDVKQQFALNGLLWERDSMVPNPEKFLATKFSPVCDDKERSILATLSRDHRVVVYCTGKEHGFIKVANLSDKLYEYAKKTDFTLSSDGKEVSLDKERSTDFEVCQSRMNSVSVTGLEWSGVLSSSVEKAPPRRGKRGAKRKSTELDAATVTTKDFILLATALKNNHVVLWQFPCPVNQKSTPQLAAVLYTDDPPTAMHWCGHHSEDSEKAYLATGGYEGRIAVWSVSSEGDVRVERELDVWMEKDDIPVQALTWVHALCTGESFVLLAAKGPCVLVFQIRLIKGSMEMAHQSHTLSMHTALVSGMCNIRDKVYTSSIDGSIQVAEVKQDNGISVDLSLLEQPKFMTTRIDGMSASTNGVYLTTVTRHSNYATHIEKSNLKFTQVATDEETGQMLMEPKGRLCYKFDCLDWLYQKLSPDKAIQDMTETILSEDVLANKTQSEILYLLKLRRLVVMMIVHRLSREIYNARGRKRDSLEEMIKTNEGQVRQISDRIVKLHIERSLEALASADETKKCSGRSKSVQKLMSDWLMINESHSKEPITSTDSVGGRDCESCRLCGENIPFTSREDGSCQNGHRWKRCSLSLMLCQTLKPKSCVFCRTCYASQEDMDSAWLQNLLRSNCLWCDGPLKDR